MTSVKAAIPKTQKQGKGCKGCGGSPKPVASTAGVAAPPAAPGNANASSPEAAFTRPRFFAGQLLDEQDLSLLEDYTLGKHRFYNRHFHDWGVVCGLAVHCDQGCHEGPNDRVLVSPGYALGPSGEDIVVRTPQHVDIAALLCLNDPKDPCAAPTPCDNDDAGEDQYVLSIEYREDCVPGARGRRCGHDAPCGCKSACGESSCASRAIAEGFTFRLTPYVPSEAKPFFEAGVFGVIQECMRPIVDAVRAAGNDLAALRRALIQLVSERPQLDCRLRQRLEAIEPPEPGTEPAQGPPVSYYELVLVMFELMQECVCDALLPPCPEFTTGGVPLALLRVRRGGTCVLGICEWGARKLAYTLPNFHYYLAPICDGIKRVLALVCCYDFAELFSQFNSYDDKGEPEVDAQAQNHLKKSAAPAGPSAPDAAPVAKRIYRVPAAVDNVLTPKLRTLAVGEIARRTTRDAPDADLVALARQAGPEVLSVASTRFSTQIEQVVKLAQGLGFGNAPSADSKTAAGSAAPAKETTAADTPTADQTIQDLRRRIELLEARLASS